MRRSKSSRAKTPLFLGAGIPGGVTDAGMRLKLHQHGIKLLRIDRGRDQRGHDLALRFAELLHLHIADRIACRLQRLA